MSDDLERRLDAFYRGLDSSAGRVEARWKSRTLRRSTTRRRWMIVGAASAAVAAALLIALSLRRPETEAPKAPAADVARPAPRLEPALPDPSPAPAPDRREEPRTEPRPPAPPPPVAPPDTTPRTPEPQKSEPPPVVPSPAPRDPKKPEVRPTLAERAVATIRESDGTFDLGDKSLRGRQKDLVVAAGDRLKAATVVKLTLGDDRFILLSPKSVVEFRPEEKRLTVAIDLGDLHAELIGAGPEVRVVTKTCEVQPLGTVFTVRAEEKKSTVIVERGRVEVRNAKGKATAKAGESVQATDDGVSAPVPADFRALSWARPHRPAESALFLEEFNKPGAWKAEIDKGVARALAGVIQVESEKPLFEVPVRGQIQVVCRADRAAKMYVQFFVREVRTNFRKEIPVLKSPAWKTLTVDIDECLPFDKTKPPGRAPAGASVHDFGLYYGEEGEKGNFWVDSIKVVEVRP
jgi:ferric-dicitrate binding protein FerR (iron transport regulator)